MSDCNSHSEAAAIIDADDDDDQQQQQHQQRQNQGEQQIQQILPNMLNKLEIRPNAGQLKLSESDCLNPFYVFNCTPSQQTKNELNEQEKLFGQNMNTVMGPSLCCKCCPNNKNSINLFTIRNNLISTKSAANLKPPEHSLYNQTQFKQRKKPDKKLLKSPKLKIIGKCLHHCLTFNKPLSSQQIGLTSSTNCSSSSNSTSGSPEQLSNQASTSLGPTSVLNSSKHEHNENNCCCCYGYYNNNNNCCNQINLNNNNNNSVTSSSSGSCSNSRYATGHQHHNNKQNCWNFHDDNEFVDFKSLITECASLSISPETAELHKSQSFRTRHIKTNNSRKFIKNDHDNQHSLSSDHQQLNPHNRTILVPIVELDEATSSTIFNSRQQQQTQLQHQQQQQQLQLDRGNGSGATCSQQALLNETNCDVTIDELASYFETFVHIPKKMSTMAEMMYI